MKTLIEILIFGLLGAMVFLLPSIMIMKIKYYKVLRKKEYHGISDLFSPFNTEWLIAGFTFGFPILGGEQNLILKTIKKRSNIRLYLLYLIILIQIVLVGILIKMD